MTFPCSYCYKLSKDSFLISLENPSDRLLWSVLIYSRIQSLLNMNFRLYHFSNPSVNYIHSRNVTDYIFRYTKWTVHHSYTEWGANKFGAVTTSQCHLTLWNVYFEQSWLRNMYLLSESAFKKHYLDKNIRKFQVAWLKSF